MLHLISVSIDGFLSHGNTGTLPLDESGITHIRGATGVGKSTIFEAVYYLLTGDTIRASRQVAALANSVLQGGYDISLNYQVDADLYKVQEIRGRTGNGLFFWKNGNPVLDVKDTRDLRLKILASLRMTPDDFCALAFVGQNQFYTLVYGKSGDRAKELVRIFGLNQYDEALKRCGADVKESVDQRALLMTQIDTIKLDLDKLEEQLIADETEQVIVQDAQIISKQAEIDRIAGLLKQVRIRYDTAVESLGQAKALRENYELMISMQNEVKELEDRLSGFAPGDQDIALLQKGYDAAKDQLATITAELNQAKEQVVSVKKLDDRCPINLEVCPVDVPRANKERRVKEFLKIIMAGNVNAASIQEEVNSADAALSSAKDRQKVQEKLSERKKDLEDLGEYAMADYSAQELKVEQLKDLYAKGEGKLKRLDDQMVELRERKAAQIKTGEYKAKLDKLLEGKRSDLSHRQTQLTEHDVEHQYLVTTLNVLKKAKAYKIDYVINRLNEKLSKNLDYLSDGVFQAWFVSQRKDATGKKFIDDIELMFSDAYKEIPIELASPGQQAYVCLAMIPTVFETARDITNKAVSSLWLDEVLGPISEDLLDRAFELLVELIKGIGVQSVKIISHRSIDTRFFDHAWDVKLENGVSIVELG
jgi:DNA repair exonuclease SbcCD ATPase subunit